MNIGERLKIARETIGYTLEKAAQLSGVGVSSISDFENSKREPRIGQLSKLAEVYLKSLEFFFSQELSTSRALLWRDPPSEEQEKTKVEAEFLKLCEQYNNLEVLTDEVRTAGFERLPKLQGKDPSRFSYEDAKTLAYDTREQLKLGETPSETLKRKLEEACSIKIFYRLFCGSAISTMSSFGPAILLNLKNTSWRRNFDLAHELFHLLTWEIFHKTDVENCEPTKREEQLADVFASALLLPEEPLKSRITLVLNDNSEVFFDKLDDIAREFGVSLEALLWRLHVLYNVGVEETKRYIELAKERNYCRPPRASEEPAEFPERYSALAVRALREGRMSQIQFAKYMGISYREAQQYLMEEEMGDEKLSISIA
jgi:XRE family transcriptional regulator, fatty acid utilization regulator